MGGGCMKPLKRHFEKPNYNSASCGGARPVPGQRVLAPREPRNGTPPSPPGEARGVPLPAHPLEGGIREL
eukprot:12863396-Heterocapsa_arctica.AAC.1